MNKYTELSKKHQEEISNKELFPVFYAFSNEQFVKGLKEIGLSLEDIHEVYTLGYGGYYKKTDHLLIQNLLTRQRKEREVAIIEDTTGEGYILDMFRYELANHEYGYTRDFDDTLQALGLTLDVINNTPNLLKGFKLAIASFSKD